MLGISITANAEKTIAPVLTINPLNPDGTPNNYPGAYQKSGVLTKITAGDRSVIISGRKYFYGLNTKVFTPQSQFSSIQSISRGTRVGVNFTTNNEENRFLYEVWVIPSSSTKFNFPSDL